MNEFKERNSNREITNEFYLEISMFAFNCRKVAAVSGDARRALDICRRATEILEEQPELRAKSDDPTSNCVDMVHVQKAIAEMISNAKVQAIRNCSRLEKNLLRAIECEVSRTGVEETTLYSVHKQLISLAMFLGDIKPTMSKFFFFVF